MQPTSWVCLTIQQHWTKVGGIGGYSLEQITEGLNPTIEFCRVKNSLRISLSFLYETIQRFYTPLTMNNCIDQRHSLEGIWESKTGLVINIRESTCHVFRGWLRCLGSHPFSLYKEEINGWINSDFKTPSKLIFFCKIDSPLHPLRERVFTCKIVYLKTHAYMLLRWLEYTSEYPNRVISSGTDMLKQINEENWRHHLQNIVVSMSHN